MLKKLIIGFTPIGYTPCSQHTCQCQNIFFSLWIVHEEAMENPPTLKIARSSPGNSIFIGHASNPP
jgi:hypothetical protein